MKTLALLPLLFLLSCKDSSKSKFVGTIERIDPELDSIIVADARPEIIAEGFEWAEGPLWVESQKMLLFSDVPRDTIYKWTEEKGKEVYLTPSGYTDTIPRGGEIGSNGLLLDRDGRLVLCQCGNRQMALMDAPLNRPAPRYISLANRYDGKRFNSPNDAVYNSKGDLFFTDPPYGLEKQMEDPTKETPYQGVYQVTQDGRVILLTDSITRPNGLAFLPGEQTLLIGNSDGDKPHWYAIDLRPEDTIPTVRIFASAIDPNDKSLQGGADGMKVDRKGNVFATGPGGVWILNIKGKLIGRIRVDMPASNVAFSADEKTLYITNDSRVLRLKMRS